MWWIDSFGRQRKLKVNQHNEIGREHLLDINNWLTLNTFEMQIGPMSGMMACNNFCVVPSHEQGKTLQWSVHDLLSMVAVIEERGWRALEKNAKHWREHYRLQAFTCLSSDRIPMKRYHYTEFRTTLPYLDGVMSICRRIVPNIELCSQNECILFEWFTIVSIHHLPCFVTTHKH